MWNRHHGEESIGVLVKCSGQDEMAQLIEAEPDLYFRPAYYGPSDWIGIALDRPRVDWDHVADWLQRSWLAMAPPRLTKLMRAAEDSNGMRKFRWPMAAIPTGGLLKDRRLSKKKAAGSRQRPLVFRIRR